MFMQGYIPRANCRAGLGILPAVVGAAGSSGSAGGGVAASAAGGPIALGITAAVMALQVLFSRRGPQQRIEATRIVNEAEPYLAANRDAYLTSDRSEANYAQALGNFDYAWGQVTELCSDPALGNPGRACISDRQRGGQWDWFAYYRDPIVAAPPVEAPASAGLFASGSASSLLLPAGLALVGVFLLMTES